MRISIIIGMHNQKKSPGGKKSKHGIRIFFFRYISGGLFEASKNKEPSFIHGNYYRSAPHSNDGVVDIRGNDGIGGAHDASSKPRDERG